VYTGTLNAWNLPATNTPYLVSYTLGTGDFGYTQAGSNTQFIYNTGSGLGGSSSLTTVCGFTVAGTFTSPTYGQTVVYSNMFVSSLNSPSVNTISGSFSDPGGNYGFSSALITGGQQYRTFTWVLSNTSTLPNTVQCYLLNGGSEQTNTAGLMVYNTGNTLNYHCYYTNSGFGSTYLRITNMSGTLVYNEIKSGGYHLIEIIRTSQFITIKEDGVVIYTTGELRLGSTAALYAAQFGNYSDVNRFSNFSISRLTGFPLTTTLALGGDITPMVDNVYSIGSPGYALRGLYTGILSASGTATFSSNITVAGTQSNAYSGSSPGLTMTGTDTVGAAGFMNFLRVTNTSSGVTNPTKTFRINQVGALGIVNNAYDSEIFNVTDSGILQVGGGAAAAAINNSPTTNYLVFNNNRSSIYDDGNMHIHTMQDGGTMWINTSGGQISMISQTVSGASLGTGVGIGTSTLTAYVTISGSKTYTIGQYGYLHPTLGAGTGAGTTAPYSLATSERIQATEFDATSDERLKDISGGITAEEAIRFVQSVSGMYYSWKSDPSGGVHTGFIAQDIHKAGFNHMVSTIPNTSLSGQVDDDGYTHPDGAQLTLNYSAITPYHHEAIKVLLDRVEKLETQISNLMSSK
jgi:hypothetical protein